jgi:hypothetical protein
MSRVEPAGPVERIAVWLALAGDEAQANFLNTFASELLRACGSHARAEMQCMYTNKKLTDDAKDLLRSLGYQGSA